MVVHLHTRRPLVQEPPYAEPDSGDAVPVFAWVILYFFGLACFLAGAAVAWRLL